MLIKDLSFNELESKLNNNLDFPFKSPYYPDPVTAAIMIIIHIIDDKWYVLLTKRSQNLNSHPGQISFPGGREDATDSDLTHTALRETTEEVGIPAEFIEIIAKLTPVTTLTGYCIHPFVAVVEQLPELSLQQEEVEHAFNIPLDWLVNPDNIYIEDRYVRERLIKTFRLDWQSHEIWGATAYMIAELIYRFSDSNPFHEASQTIKSKD